jgi:hypothetical protein
MEEQTLMDPLHGMSESLLKLSIELEATGVEKDRSKKRIAQRRDSSIFGLSWHLFGSKI